MTSQLALVEVGRLRRSPALWAAVAATAALLWWLDRRQPMMPNMASETIMAATAVFIVAATLMIIANLATLRDQRGAMPETLAALPGRATVRTRAVVVATACAGAGLAAAIIGPYLLLRMTTGPVAWGFDVFETLAAVVGVTVLAVLGVMLGRWLPTLIATPVFLVVLVLFIAERNLDVWFLPLTEGLSGAALGAPSHLRLLYLSSVVVFAVMAALLRHRRTPLLVGGTIVTLAVLVALALALPGSVPSEAIADADRRCTDRNGVTYCHLPGFAAWVPLWARATEPVFNALPSNVRDRFPTIHQYQVSPGSAPGPVDGHVNDFWGRGELQVESETFLAGTVAAELTGFDAADRAAGCDGRGQARTVVALWLAGHAAPIPRPDERDVMGATHLGVVYGEREHRHVITLLERPDTRALIGRHWDTLTDPDTTIEQAAPLLQLPPRFPAEQPAAQACR